MFNWFFKKRTPLTGEKLGFEIDKQTIYHTDIVFNNLERFTLESKEKDRFGDVKVKFSFYHKGFSYSSFIDSNYPYNTIVMGKHTWNDYICECLPIIEESKSVREKIRQYFLNRSKPIIEEMKNIPCKTTSALAELYGIK